MGVQLSGGPCPTPCTCEWLDECGRWWTVDGAASGAEGHWFESSLARSYKPSECFGSDGARTAQSARREVLHARGVSHRNVCRVYELYDATTRAGVPIHFLTMELLEGETLTQRISRQGRLTTTEALPLVRQLCEGLAAAHAEGVIHRDFKSGNVMLVPRRGGPAEASATPMRVAITDFGIARAVQASGTETGAERLTGGASALGTPEYMAPEQVSGNAVTPATDIYALGVVLYEMVTGELPFTGETPLAIAAKLESASFSATAHFTAYSLTRRVPSSPHQHLEVVERVVVR